MMKYGLFCFLILLCFPVAAICQPADYSKIDAHARSVRYSQNQDLHSLAAVLSEGCQTEKEKTRAFFVWICDNIKYDVKTFENRKDIDPEKTHAMQTPERVLRSRKAVCEGYSNLFVALCREAGIKAMVVSGVSKNDRGIVSRTGHAWCIVRADGTWGLVDPTWGAGDVDADDGKYKERFKEAYFFTAPALMILDHYPKDPLFQLLAVPITLEAFKQPAANLKTKLAQQLAEEARPGYAQLSDSLNAFVALDSSAMQYNAGTRILELDPGNNFGLYLLGQYYYNLGYQHIDVYQAKMTPVQEKREKASKQWCDEELILLTKAKKELSSSIAVFSRSVRSDDYSNSIRAFRHGAEAALKTIEINMKSMKSMREKMK